MVILSQNVSMRRAWIVALLAVVAAGCGPKINQFGGKYQQLPKSIISISPSTTEILMLSNNTSQKLKGRSEFCDYPSVVVHMPVFAGVKPDYEKLKSTKPDLVVYEASLYSPADIAKLKETVGDHNIYEFHSKTVKDFETQLKEMAGICDCAIDISQYIDKIESQHSLG